MHPVVDILETFGAEGAPERLPGGRGATWRSGDIILKPLDVLPEELAWLDEVARGRGTANGIRLSLPLRSRSQQLIVDGWTAFPRLEGDHRPGRWLEIAEVAREFAALFAGVGRPDFLDRRDNAWARADRYAWGEGEGSGPEAAPRVAELVDARREVADLPGIVHADLAGNVLFAAGLSPAVIDLTVYWRPVGYSIAVVAVDAVCFEGAPLTLLETISTDRDFPQQLVRALLFRIVTDWFNGRPADEYGVYDTAVDRVLELNSNDR
ncbi:TIGR02569 family protein [Leifsonia sp. NPDC058248]|uniref:TIGR02569 family protein n=1 Tax=Leifsonia sp. NPDC058248 TaxID=3346402 RepID=UPI0036DE355F